MEKFSLQELNDYIRRVIALNFQDSVWITAEISQVGISKGHRYIDLLERDSRNTITLAQAKANLWYKTYLKINKKLDVDINSLLVAGTQILIKVKIVFHEKYGISLTIEDIEPSFTIGKNALQKQITKDKLQKEGAFTKNTQNNFPLGFKKIAIISSPTAAGYIDFINQLQTNAYGYTFEIDMYPVKVQGQYAVAEIIKALTKIEKGNSKYEAIIIIRGGGSKLDLAAFDDYELCSTASKVKTPIITGIGHEIDTAILDLVAHTNVKTPTAAAEFLINHNLYFESNINETAQVILNNTKLKLQNSSLYLSNIQYNIERSSKNKIHNNALILDNIEKTLPFLLKVIFKNQNDILSTVLNKAKWSDPKKILKRGYSISTIDGVLIKNRVNISKGETLKTQFENNTIESEIK